MATGECYKKTNGWLFIYKGRIIYAYDKRIVFFLRTSTLFLPYRYYDYYQSCGVAQSDGIFVVRRDGGGGGWVKKNRFHTIIITALGRMSVRWPSGGGGGGNIGQNEFPLYNAQREIQRARSGL